MITLLSILTLYCISGWIYRYKRSKKDRDYEFNPFHNTPTLFSLTLVFTTIILIGIAGILIIKYLP